MAGLGNTTEKITLLQDELICPICLELFDQPVQLPCLHSFCLKCIDAKIKRDNNPTIIPYGFVMCTCPTCRKRSMLSNVNTLPKNFSLASIVEKFKQVTGLKKVMCTIHNQDVGLFCEDCSSLMCFSCFGDHKDHKIDDVKRVCDRYKSKMEVTLLPGLYMKQRQLQDAMQHWNGIIQTEKDGKCLRNLHISREIASMKKMLQDQLVERVKGMAMYNIRLTDQLITQCESKKKTVEKELINVNKLISDIISDTDPAKTLLTYTEISKRGDHDIEKLSECAKDLPNKKIEMLLDPVWRKKLEEFANSVKLILSGVEEEGPEIPVAPLDKQKIFSLENLPRNVQFSEMEEQIKVLIPLKDILSRDVVFNKQEVIVHFTTLNVEILNLYKETSVETVFEWKFNLRHEILPARSRSSTTDQGIEIILIKAKKEHWGTVENTASTKAMKISYKNEICRPKKSPEPTPSFGSVGRTTRSSAMKRSSIEGQIEAGCTKMKTKKTNLVPSNEQVELLIKTIDKEDIVNFIKDKITSRNPHFDITDKTQSIQDIVSKMWGIDAEDE